ncbi:hypothetical protein WICPIJ_008075 [Wickerhamomyces pijperi]|uniref:Uncharacterized protein n=1 Tax=Wickerhamomyces pijperi TaxID=599730 RepID=A0A9P8Q0B3_WICPI|nr:hypothetical protein WICPIJ_008075 [Wickerhamomyces pijperi]
MLTDFPKSSESISPNKGFSLASSFLNSLESVVILICILALTIGITWEATNCLIISKAWSFAALVEMMLIFNSLMAF